MSDEACTCFPVKDPWTYYGVVEPGGAMEPNPDCPVHFPKKRLTAWSDESTRNSDGTYFVAVCRENVPGYWELDGSWSNLEDAKKEAIRINTVRGLSDQDVLDIRTSSIAEHNAGWRASDDDLAYPKAF